MNGPTLEAGIRFFQGLQQSPKDARAPWLIAEDDAVGQENSHIAHNIVPRLSNPAGATSAP